MLGEDFDHFVVLDLEYEKDARIFRENDTVEDIMIVLRSTRRIPKNEGVLLFIDEIQAEPKAIAMLRYFYERMPSIHVIAAGSLLEFSLGEVESFPVGRVEFYYLHPLTFAEFLLWNGKDDLLEAYNNFPIRSVYQ